MHLRYYVTTSHPPSSPKFTSIYNEAEITFKRFYSDNDFVLTKLGLKKGKKMEFWYYVCLNWYKHFCRSFKSGL